MKVGKSPVERNMEGSQRYHGYQNQQLHLDLSQCLKINKNVSFEFIPFFQQSCFQYSLFHSLLNRGAANNACYPPANCQQREITILSSRSLKIGLFSLISEVQMGYTDIPLHPKSKNGIRFALALPVRPEIGLKFFLAIIKKVH